MFSRCRTAAIVIGMSAFLLARSDAIRAAMPRILAIKRRAKTWCQAPGRGWKHAGHQLTAAVGLDTDRWIVAEGNYDGSPVIVRSNVTCRQWCGPTD